MIFFVADLSFLRDTSLILKFLEELHWNPTLEMKSHCLVTESVLSDVSFTL